MQHILVYGDSLTWGIIPDTRQRLPFHSRWPGVAEAAIVKSGLEVRLVEDCLNGRRTAWDDPFKPGRNGRIGVEQRIEAQSPLALVILMLGSNDFQSVHPHDAWHSAQGIASLVTAIRRAPIEPGMPVPEILIVAPPPFLTPKGSMAPKFEGARAKSARLSDAYRQVAKELVCHFFDAGEVTSASEVDGVHLDADQHARLGHEIARHVTTILSAQGRT